MALRLALGSFTPFLMPYWQEEEQEDLHRWMAGENFPEAGEKLGYLLSNGLEKDFSAYPVNLGRTAIYLALTAAHLPKDSEVLLSTFCCTGLIMPVVKAGLRPVFVDVDDEFNVRLESILEVTSPKVSAIIV